MIEKLVHEFWHSFEIMLFILAELFGKLLALVIAVGIVTLVIVSIKTLVMRLYVDWDQRE